MPTILIKISMLAAGLPVEQSAKVIAIHDGALWVRLEGNDEFKTIQMTDVVEFRVENGEEALRFLVAHPHLSPT